MEVPGEIEQLVEEMEVFSEFSEDEPVDPCIFVNALSGSQNYQTMRVK